MKKFLLFSLFVILSNSIACLAQSVIIFDTGQESPGILKDDIDLTSIDPSISGATRYRKVNLNTTLQDASLIHVNDTILLNLFYDKEYKAVVEKTVLDVNNVSVIRAILVDLDHSYCVISSLQGQSFMEFEIPQNKEQYELKFNYASEQHYLVDLDPQNQNYLEDSPPIIPPIQDPANDPGSKNLQQGVDDPIIQQSPLDSDIDQDTIKVMVVYTPEAANWASAYQTSIQNIIGVMMDRANLTLENSLTNLNLELVFSVDVDYDEVNSSADLYNLKNDGDGFMDEIHCLREAKKADLVVMLANVSFVGGIAFLLNSTYGRPDYGFSLVRVQQASGYTTIHEIGHNLGCHHHKEQNYSPGPGIKPYSAGWRWIGVDTRNYCSVMTYNSGAYFDDGIYHSWVPFFSNPNIQYQGVSVGDPVDGDNARTIRETKHVVSLYKNDDQLVNSSIESVVGDELMVNYQGKVYANIFVKQEGTYFIGIWDKRGLKGPHWDFSPDYTPLSPDIGSLPTYYNRICEQQTIEFDVIPISESGTFEFWLYRQLPNGSYTVEDKAEFTLNASKELEALIQIDFSMWGSVYDGWNKTANLSPDDGAMILQAPLIGVKGNEYPYSITVEQKFDGPNYGGMTSGIYPSDVIKRGYYVNNSEAMIKIHQLNKVKIYSLEFFGSKNGYNNEDYSTVFTALDDGQQGESVSLNVYDNISNTVVLEQLKPNQNGEILVSVKKGAGAVAGYLNALVLREYNPGIPLKVIASVTNPTCAESSDGSIELDIVGGSPPFSISWDNAEIGSDLANLYEGIYSVAISDDNNDAINRSFSLKPPPPLTVKGKLIWPKCEDHPTGDISFLVNGGVAPYKYQFSGYFNYTDMTNTLTVRNKILFGSGDMYENYLYDIQTDKLGNIYLLEYSENEFVFGGLYVEEGGFLIKLSTDFEPVWKIAVPTFIESWSVNDSGETVIASTDNLTKVSTDGQILFDLSLTNITSMDQDNKGNIFILQDNILSKYNALGTMIWEKEIAQQSESYNSSKVFVTDHIIIGGSGNGQAQIGDTTLFINGFYIAKLSEEGELIWSFTPKLSEAQYLRLGDVAMDQNGNVYIYGELVYDMDKVIFDDNHTLVNSGVFLAKFDSYGDIIWLEGISPNGFGLMNWSSIGSNNKIAVSYGLYSTNRTIRTYDLDGTLQYELVGMEPDEDIWDDIHLCYDRSGNLIFGGVLQDMLTIAGEIFETKNAQSSLFLGKYGYQNYLEVREVTSAAIQVMDKNGCLSSTDIDINSAEMPFRPEICTVTKDSQTGGNKIIWPVPQDYYYGGYRIYREYLKLNQFVSIGEDAYPSDGVFIDDDLLVKSDANSYRYRIAMLHYCDPEITSEYSPIHRTAHLMANLGLNGEVNLLWKPYEGFDYTHVTILRGTDPSAMHQIDVVPSNLTSYTDINPVSDEVYYQLEIEGPGNCGPVVVNGRSSVNKRISRSNIIHKENTITEIDDFRQIRSELTIYPVPSTKYLNIEMSEKSSTKIKELLFSALQHPRNFFG